MIISQEFINHLLLLLGLMYGFTTLKIALCKPFVTKGEKFSWKKLFRGTLRQLIVISGTLIVYFVGNHCGADLLLIQIGDSKLTIAGAVDVTILAVVAVYGAKYIKHLAEFMGITEQEDETTTNECDHGELIGYCYSAKDNSCTTTCTSDYLNAESVDIDTIIEEAGYGDELDDSGDDLDEEAKG